MNAIIFRMPLGMLFIVVILFAPTRARAVEAVWIGGSSGNWSDPANWSTGVVPNLATTNVTIDDGSAQESVTLLDQNATVGNLWVDSGDTLNVDASRLLIASSATIAGNVNFATSSRLQVGNSVWVQESGVLSLADTSRIVDTTNPYYVLWNEGRIEGAGQISSSSIGAVLNNDGTVVADVSGKQLTVGLYGTASRGIHSNHGQLIADNGGTLLVAGLGDPPAFFTPLDNLNGIIEARGDSMVSLSKIRLVGGQLSTTSVGGTNEGLITLNSVMFENVTLEGNLALNSVTFSDRVVNNTHSVVNSFFVEGYAKITGNGSMDLNGGAINIPGQQYGGQFVGTPGFVNDVNHTIQGPGAINSSQTATRLVFDNRGVIETAEGTLQINLRSASQTPNSMAQTVNSGTIRAKTGGRVEMGGSSYNDILNNSAGATSGIVEAGVDSTVELGTMTLRGGILRAVAPAVGETTQGGKIITEDTVRVVLEDLRLEGKIGDTPANSRWNLAGEIQNTGTLAGGLAIVKPTNLTGGGDIRVETGGGIVGSSTTFDGFYDPLINEDNLIHGYGTIGPYIAFTNRGIVQSDVNNRILTILPNVQSSTIESYPTFNSGELKAINGGDLGLAGPVVNFEGSELGTIHAGDGSEVRVATIVGGILSTEGTGKIITTTASQIPYLTDIHNLGNLVIGADIEVRGRVTNDGSVSQLSGKKAYVGPFTELTGGGTWGTSNIPLALEVGASIPTAGLFINGAEHTIQGGGTINVARGSFVNRGTVVSNGTNPLTITLAAGTTMQQQGTLVVGSSRALKIEINDERFANRGVIDAEGTFQLERLNAGSIEFRNMAGAELNVGSTFSVLSSNAGSSLWNQVGALIAGHGNVNLYSPQANHQTLLLNSGTLRPEGADDPTGELTISGNIQQDVTGVLEIDLGGSPNLGEFDRLHITNGGALLGGTLDISLLSEYDPAVGDAFTILDVQGGTITGAFDNFSAPALSGRWWSLDYLSDRVVLNINAITADFDGNGFVDVNDLDDWRSAYQAGNTLGDADGDGDSDGRDFLAWQRQYGSGIPVAGVMSVPEPSSLLLLGICGTWFARRRSTQLFR